MSLQSQRLSIFIDKSIFIDNQGNCQLKSAGKVSMARPKGNDKDFNVAFSAKLRQAIEDRGLSVAAAAKELGVCRQSLYNYLSGHTTPGGNLVRTACQKWAIALDHNGFHVDASCFPGPQLEASPLAEQLQLPLMEAIQNLADENVTINIRRKDSGSVTFEVQLKFGS